MTQTTVTLTVIVEHRPSQKPEEMAQMLAGMLRCPAVLDVKYAVDLSVSSDDRAKAYGGEQCS